MHGGPTSQTRVNTAAGEQGTYDRDVPLLAARQVGKGRLLYLGITPEYLFGPPATITLGGIVLDQGLRDIPSGGYRLLTNALRWLSEPSAATFRGATPDPSLLANPRKTIFAKAFPWEKKWDFPAVEPAYPGVIGARTRYSSGKATVDEWVAKAKANGLAYIVFLEEFNRLSREEFERLKADCARVSSPEFSAIPGFVIDDEIGNHYFYFGPSFPYPDSKVLSRDRTVFVSYDPRQEDPYTKGQLAMTTLEYAYTQCGFKFTRGNYLFGQDAAPFADFFSNWDAVGVITSRQGKIIEDATQDFLALVDSGQGPLPMAIDLLDDPAQLDASTWRTVLRLPADGGKLESGVVNGPTKIRDYFALHHYYPDNPSKIYITEGPAIESWGYIGPRDYAWTNDGWFNWQNLRWRLRGVVSSPAGLKEVAVYDGRRLFRRFLPDGKARFEFTLDLTHNQQHNLALIVTDMQGRRAIGGEQWDRHQFLQEFQCGDRNNQLSFGKVTNSAGINIQMGGGLALATPNKRIDAGSISPAGVFKGDALLGAPAFDGAAVSEPQVRELLRPRQPVRPVMTPTVSESRRLLHTGDVHIGEGERAHAFTDDIPVGLVWRTLWRTQPASDYTVTKRNYFFQIDADSPLAVFLWCYDITLKADMPNEGFDIALLTSGDDQKWVVRGSDGTLECGEWEEPRRSPARRLTAPFGAGAYGAFLDSTLGGAAVYSLTEGLQVSLTPPTRGNLRITLPPAAALQKQGETKRVELLLVGLPRGTGAKIPDGSSGVVARFARDFGLDGKPADYIVKATAGKVSGQRYILNIDGSEAGFTGTITGKLISSLPIAVSGLNDNWSSFLYDRTLKKARPLGTFEGRAWATVVLNGGKDLFIGQPFTADHPRLVIQLTQTSDIAWSVELHNPTDAPIITMVRANPLFEPLKGKSRRRIGISPVVKRRTVVAAHVIGIAPPVWGRHPVTCDGDYRSLVLPSSARTASRRSVFGVPSNVQVGHNQPPSSCSFQA